MNRVQLQREIITPMLNEIPKGLTRESLLAVTMIIAHESRRGEFICQVGGPALGVIGMEPETHNSTWKWGDSIWDNAHNAGIISDDEWRRNIHPPAERLIYDLRYNVFMCRQRLFMKFEALPSDMVSMSIYLKRNWNSVMGAATNKSYLEDYELWLN